MNRVRILITDDHPLTRKGAQQLLQGAFPGATFGEAETAAKTLDLARTSTWDLVLLDLSLPDRSGLECLDALKRFCPDLPVLVVSMHEESQFAVRSLKAGAAGYVTKDRAPEELLKAVHRVLGGGKYLSEEMAERLALGLCEEVEKHPHETLSRREYQIMCLIASGKSLTSIAEQVSLSVKTVGTYRARVLKKMGMRGNAELMRYCIQNKLV